MVKTTLIISALLLCVACNRVPEQKEIYDVNQVLIEDVIAGYLENMAFPTANYTIAEQEDGTYIITSYFDYTDKGNETLKRFNYKSKLRYIGGDCTDKKNWILVFLQEQN
ncbi:MAG: hypothetical protein PUB21_07125 [Bacteroidales bacterium]|nr:hypothetical protein [Bacteroidales bacterium]